MNRRSFLAGTTAIAALATAETARARESKTLTVLIPATPPDQLAELKAAAPGVELVVCRDAREALEQASNADASYGFITRDIIRAGKRLRWVQQPSAGVEQLMQIPELV